MTNVVSLINLKGGVGKTFFAVNMAAEVAHRKGERTLLIDLDPQTNATISVIEQDEWAEKSDQKRTLHQMYSDLVMDTTDFDINSSIIKNINEIPGFDLLPSDFKLIKLIPKLESDTHTVFELKKHIDEIDEPYKNIIIDCPPSLGKITLSGLFISDKYVVPTVPDIISTIGIPYVREGIEIFNKKYSGLRGGKKVEGGHIIFSKVETRNAKMTDRVKRKVKTDYGSLVFDAEIPQRAGYGQVAEQNKAVCVAKSSYYTGTEYATITNLTDLQSIVYRAGVEFYGKCLR